MNWRALLGILFLLALSFPTVHAAILFEVNWSTTTGKSTAALTDGGKLTEYGYPASLLLTTVDLPPQIPAYWPTNGLEIRFDSLQSASLVGRENGWAAPPLGGSIYYRFFLYNALPANSGVANEHGMQTNIGALSHAWQLFSPDGSTGTMGFHSNTLQGAYFANGVPANKPLRVEWALHRTTGTNANLEIRIFDETVSNTTPILTKDNFRENWGEGPNDLGDLGPINFLDVDNAFRSYLFGVSGSSASAACCVYVTGFAVTHDGWIGGIEQTQQAIGPNQPAGHTTRVNSALSGSTIAGNGAWGDGWTIANFIDPGYNLTMRVTNNPAAPVSPTQVLEVEQTTASAAGGGPRIDRNFAAANDTYLSFWFRLTPGFDITNVPSHKIAIIEPNNIIMSLAHWCPDYNGGNCLTQSRQILLTVASLVPGTGEAGYLNTLNLPGVRTNTPITTGDWHRVEMRLQRRGVGQGIIEWWIDGVLQGQHTGLTIGNAQDGVPFDLLRIAPQASGFGTQAIQTQAIQYDHIYLSTGTGGTAPTDTTPPTATITAPATTPALPAGTTSTTLSVTTNEASTCRWSTTDVAYGSMLNTMSGGGTTSHSATITGLTEGGSNATYVRCSDTANNAMTTSVSRSFSVMPTQIYFESDWSTAYGRSYEAWTDGGKWPGQGSSGTSGRNSWGGEVVSASTLEFPSTMSKVLRVPYHGNYGAGLESSGSVRIGGEHEYRWSAPQGTQTLFHRFYFRNDIRDAASVTGRTGHGSNHPFQGFDYLVNPICTLEWEYRWGSNPDGTFIFNIAYIQNTPNAWELTLNKSQTYLLEFAYTRVGTNQYTVRARIDGIEQTNNFARPTAPLTLAEAGALNISDHCLRTLFIGNNDPYGWAQTDGTPWSDGANPLLDFAYYGGVAVAVRNNQNDWIGPYNETSEPPPTGSGPVITVDSTYVETPPYLVSVIDDSIINSASYTSGTWASAESTTEPHWIELTFPTPVSLSSFTIYWTNLGGTYLVPQQMNVQRWDGSAWQTLTTITNTGNNPSSTVNFVSANTARYRLYQPANQGNPAYASVLWLTEVDYTLAQGTARRTGDLDGNGIVNILDVTLIIQNFKRRQSYDEGADINGDGTVNIFDMVLLGRNWG